MILNISIKFTWTSNIDMLFLTYEDIRGSSIFLSLIETKDGFYITFDNPPSKKYKEAFDLIYNSRYLSSNIKTYEGAKEFVETFLTKANKLSIFL